MLSRRGSGCPITMVRTAALGAKLPVTQAPRNGKCCPKPDRPPASAISARGGNRTSGCVRNQDLCNKAIG
jgi:hypothetical protein